MVQSLLVLIGHVEEPPAYFCLAVSVLRLVTILMSRQNLSTVRPVRANAMAAGISSLFSTKAVSCCVGIFDQWCSGSAFRSRRQLTIDSLGATPNVCFLKSAVARAAVRRREPSSASCSVAGSSLMPRLIILAIKEGMGGIGAPRQALS